MVGVLSKVAKKRVRVNFCVFPQRKMWKIDEFTLTKKYFVKSTLYLVNYLYNHYFHEILA